MSSDGATDRNGTSPAAAAEAGLPDLPQLLRRVPAILYTASRGIDATWHYVSPQIESILGFTPAEWRADPTLWRRRLHPDDLPRVLANETDPRLDEDDSGAIEYRLIHRDGRIVWIRDDAALVAGPDGPRWIGVLSDVTERRLTEAELERAAAQHAAIAALGEHALEGASFALLAEEAIAAGCELLGMRIAALSKLDAESEGFRVIACRGLGPTDFSELLPTTPQLQPGYALAHGQVVVEDWATETRFDRTPAMDRAGVRSGLSVAVEGRDGRFGVLGLHDTEPREFPQADVDFVQALANVLGDAFVRQLTEEEIRHRALHDPLTGLANRTLFTDRLGQAIRRLRRHEGGAAILFLDVDRFKLVNESFGHDAGDALLSAAALRLGQTVRATDTVARFGADEFAIMLEDIGGEQDAVEMAQRIASVFTRPFVIDDGEHFVTTSIGISMAGGGNAPEDLLGDAEAAMHRAKERGGARYELFDAGLRGRAASRLRVENDLRRALERDEFTLDYQPIVSLRDRSLRSVEALLRWEHPERGRVPPLDFIPIAEENGLIVPIGRWVLERACRDAAEWARERPDAAPISVAVNLSAVQFDDPGLAGSVACALRGADLDAPLLALEITESVMMGHAAELGETLEALKAIGVRLVLDDFGTGYSSLAYLSRLPLDVLKVDRSFVDGLGREGRDAAITEAIVAMSHALSLRTVGEGAETETHVGELARLGCDFVQGFFFSRPVPGHEIARMLREGPPWAPAADRDLAARSVQRVGARLQR